MVPQDLSRANLLSALDGARVVYFDARMPDNALVIAQEVITSQLLPSLSNAKVPYRIIIIRFVFTQISEIAINTCS